MSVGGRALASSSGEVSSRDLCCRAVSVEGESSRDLLCGAGSVKVRLSCYSELTAQGKAERVARGSYEGRATVERPGEP